MNLTVLGSLGMVATSTGTMVAVHGLEKANALVVVEKMSTLRAYSDDGCWTRATCTVPVRSAVSRQPTLRRTQISW